MTTKLYYENAYVQEFEARVISVTKVDTGFDTVLDRTAFFPEEGGQYSDTGTLNGAYVSHVFEEDGVIHHIVSEKLAVDSYVFGKINFDERYEKMQCHTGEHILSGIFHSLYGYDNVGFHLGKDEVTMDINAVLTEEQIIKVELLANRVIYENVAVSAFFPKKDELASIQYRSKLDITENVRIVKIGEYDSCACCAPHVKTSGEVGIIRMLDFVKHRGGTRITIIAGMRALRDYRTRYEEIRKISALLSVPKSDVSDGVKKLVSDYEFQKSAYKEARRVIFEKNAESIPVNDGNTVLYYPDANFEELSIVANSALARVGGMLVLLSGKENDYKYLIVSKTVNLRDVSKNINCALSGRGGGKPEAIQGSFSASLEEIRSYFDNKNTPFE